jgi:hypothetical protein
MLSPVVMGDIMNLKITFISVLFAVLVVLPGCSSNTGINQSTKNFFESNNPILNFGSDDEVENQGIYDSILTYSVDNKGNVYISDISNLKIDKFHHTGNYLFAFGGKTHESIQFPGWIHRFAVDSKENLIAYSAVKRKFLLFNSDGKVFRKKDFNIDLKNLRIKRLKINRNDRLFLLAHSDSRGYQLFKYDLETKEYFIIHTDNKRTQPAFKDLLPDYAFDSQGNIYITDNIEYRIFKYANNGQLIDTFSRKAKKLEIRDQDFNFLMRRNRIRKIPNYKDAWKELKGHSGLFPAIFGINIDGKRIYVWTCHQDLEKKYLVDVYDLNFKHLYTTSYYNEMGINRVFIKNQRLYIPNIGSDDIDLKRTVGRFGVFNIPHKINV